MIDKISFEEAAVLAAIIQPMSLLDAMKRAAAILRHPKFDSSVALSLIPDLVKRGLLHREGSVVEPTRAGLEAALCSVGVLRTLEDQLQKINPCKVKW